MLYHADTPGLSSMYLSDLFHGPCVYLCSGTHLFNCVRCDGSPALAQWMASLVCYHLHHGCSHFCLSYDQALRDVIDPDTTAPDFRPVPWLASLQAQLPYLDFAADYVGGSQTVQELVL
jgi:hypothetical protein